MNPAKVTEHNPWLILTGGSRGIGAALKRQLLPHFNILSLARSIDEEAQQWLKWDLAHTLEHNPFSELKQFLSSHSIAGFLHCGGILGPVGSPQDDYWQKFTQTMQINTTSALELISFTRPFIKVTHGNTPPFVLHLSSGAARNPYVGWEAYCISKAALLMGFECLSRTYAPEQLLALSVAPGTVMTDMMKQVLKSDPTAFPSVTKFKKLQDDGGLVDADVPAVKIKDLLLKGGPSLLALHGKFFDIRTEFIKT